MVSFMLLSMKSRSFVSTDVFGSTYVLRLCSKYQLWFSLKMLKSVTNSRSTSVGLPFGPALPLPVTIMAPMRPASLSLGSHNCAISRRPDYLSN